MAFRDWVDVEASNPLILPINGKTYRIPAMGHLDAIKLREDFARVENGEMPQLTNDDFLACTLSVGVLEAMRADNVPARAIIHAATVAHVDALRGREAAEEMWEHGPNPEALAAGMAAAAKLLSEKLAQSESSTTSPSTPPPTPTSSTRSRASTRPTKSQPKRASRSRGATSSTARPS